MEVVNSIQEKLWKKFGKENIRVSVDANEFDLSQTGIDYFSSKKDVQFYAYEEGEKFNIISFNKSTPQNLALVIALNYCNGYLGSKLPTDLVLVFNARNTIGRNEDGTFNSVIHPLTKNQIDQIEKEYEELVAEA